ncbi:MAG: PEP-CTERM system TPR-repeat protein PrsT [Alphaproteobacteria bacterium]|nr:PEP-CTERM system TPR-repeat protein PrsT [Alphaproteobacteria bacterium]
MKLALLCVTTMLIAGTAHASQNSAADISESGRLLTAGRALIQNGEYRPAMIQLKKAVKADPGNAEARFELGLLHFRGGDFLAAEKEFLLAREGGFDLAQVNPLLANTYLAAGKFQRVLDDIAPCPADPACKADVLALRARAFLALRKPDDADKESLAALAADPDSETGRTTRAIILMVRNDNGEAERIIDTVLLGNPRNGEAQTAKGDLRRRAGDLDTARIHYQTALETAPNDTRIRQSQALTLMALGKDDEARAEITQVLGLTPKAPMALYLKAALLVRANKIPEALDTVRPAESAIAQIPQGTFLLALIHSRSNNLEEAVNYATKFHNTAPDSLVGAKLLADIHFRLHAFPKVIAILAPLRDRLGDDDESLSLLGSAYLAEGQIKEANELLTEAAKTRPNDPSTRARLALSRAGQASTREEGIRELEGLVASGADTAQVDLALVSSHIGNGDYDKAIAAAAAMAARQPKAPLPPTLSGAARLAKGDRPGARGDFQSALAGNPDYVPAAVYLSELDMQDGLFDSARRTLDTILKRKPGDLRALQARAQVETRANKPAASIPFLETAIKLHPGEIRPRVYLLRAHSATGDKDKLAATALDLARTQSGNPAAIDLAARALLSVGRSDDGLNLYRQMQTRFPDMAQSHERYGQALALLGRDDEARTAFDRAISAEPRALSAWINRIALERKISGHDAAMAMAETARIRNPDVPAAQVIQGDLLSSAGDAAQAETAYRKAFEQAPSSVTVVRLFHALARKGDSAAAGNLLTTWLKANPDDSSVRVVLAGHKSLHRDYRGAAAEYEAVAVKLPRNAAVLNNLAWTYGHLGDARAVETARRAYSMSPDSPAIMDTYGSLLYRDGLRPQGRELVKRAFAATPGDPQVAYHMAVILVDSKDLPEARSILKGVVDSKVAFDGADEARKLYSDLSGS